ncbi:hypothetical protein AVEN_103611-1 [Araneus ventricosus]|uniref:Uncharacterized protein n=1 Tax=Araneus ventricosus TaxID=182803 RepID=A0A4Y2I7E4_ARAVE|nr:hypothetical protein AVEN_103611-1 [Araneus ventricosus]
MITQLWNTCSQPVLVEQIPASNWCKSSCQPCKYFSYFFYTDPSLQQADLQIYRIASVGLSNFSGTSKSCFLRFCLHNEKHDARSQSQQEIEPHLAVKENIILISSNQTLKWDKDLRFITHNSRQSSGGKSVIEIACL